MIHPLAFGLGRLAIWCVCVAPGAALLSSTLADASVPAIHPAGIVQDWVFSNSFEVDNDVPARVDLAPDSWLDAWVGARQQFTARVTNANGRPLAVPVLWSTNSPAVDVDASGLATAMNPGGVHAIHATPQSPGGVNAPHAAEGMPFGSAAVNIVYDGDRRPELLYTTWFARTDKAPAILINGEFKLPFLPSFYGTHEIPTPPWPDNRRTDANNQLIPEPRPTIAKFQWAGNTIGLLTDVANGAGTLRVRGRVGEWVTLAVASAVDFQLAGSRIAVLLDDGRFLAKDGIHGPWVLLAGAGSNIRSFQVEGNYIALLFDDGLFRIKEGLNGPWTNLANPGSGMSSFQVDGNHIALLSEVGALIIKDGIHGGWTSLASSGVDAFKIAVQAEPGGIFRPYIGLLRDGGDLYLKHTINGPWVNAASDVVDFQLEANPYQDVNDPRVHIGALHSDGRMRVKETHTGPWTLLAAAGTGVESFQLRHALIALMRSGGVLHVKSGVNGGWVQSPAYGAGVTQYDPLVSVPSPPYRTTIASHAREHLKCQSQSGCYPNILPWAPAPLYGRFCGAGVPADWGWAVAQGQVDSMDKSCMHHDMAAIWYPEAMGIIDFETCIVRYALRFSRLTQNGTLLTHGADTDQGWNLAWGSNMPALKAALDMYFPLLVPTCPLSAEGPANDLEDFEFLTR